MMTNTKINPEREQLAKIVDKYRQKGYEILFPPDYENLPDFIAKYNPDLVVRNDRETVVVQVRSARASSITKTQYLSHLAQEVAQYPNWRLELLTTKTNNKDYILYESWQIDEIRSRLHLVEQLAEQYSEAALLYCWSSLEATVRLLVEKEHLSLQEFDLQRLIKELVFNGIISRSQYQTLKESVGIRNAIAHGFRTQIIDRSYVRQLIQLLQELLTDLESN